MSTNQSRKPPGTPAGGQWAPSRHNEADIDLGAPAPTMPGAFDAALSGGAGGPGQYAELQTATLHTGRRPIPNDIQRLAYSAFQVADKQITAEDVEDGMAEAVDRGSETYIDFLSALKGRDSDLSPWQDLDNPMSLTLSPRGALVPERP
jgi:hypothetical protein